MKINLLKLFTRIPFLESAFHFIKRLKLPGFSGLPLYEVIVFLFQRFNENDLQTRARAIAFSLFLAIFPTIIFLFTLIPYIPIDNFQIHVLLLLRDFLPTSTYEAAYTTIEDIVSHQRGGLLSFGFLFALFVSADGITNIMEWFNKSYHGKYHRSQLKQKLIAVSLTIVLALFVFIAITLGILSEVAISFLVKHDFLTNDLQVYLLQILKWVVIILLCFSGISLLYYFGPSEKRKISYLTPGALLATVLVIVTSLLFNFFVNNFGSYNKVYGSIGTLMVILIWTYLNSLVLLIGFELNISISHATKSHEKRKTALKNS